MNILFVCTGNTCRSPMAEALLKEKLSTVEVKSAGIFANENETANEHAVQVLNEMAISVTHVSQSISLHNLHWADVVLTMTENHKAMLHQLYPQYENKVFTLIEYVLEYRSTSEKMQAEKDIPDPFGGDIEIYRHTVATLDDYIEKLVHKIIQNKG